MYGLIVASLVAIAYGMLRPREGFQAADFTNKQMIGMRVSSSDTDWSEFIKSTSGIFSSGFKIVDVASGKVVFYIRNTVGTLDDVDNLLTNDTTIKLYDIFLGGDNSSVPGGIDGVLNKRIKSEDEKSPIIRNIILKDTTTGSITYYPATPPPSVPAITPVTTTTSTATPTETNVKDKFTPLEIGAIAGGSFIGLVLLIFIIVKSAS